MANLGVKIVKATKDKVVVERKTRESEIVCTVDAGKRREFKIDTGLQFLNHMIETIAWRLCMNIDLSFKAENFKLTHVIAEDSGLVLGRALSELLAKKAIKGVNSSSRSIIDEAGATAAISVEGRPMFILEGDIDVRTATLVEDTKVCDLDDFLAGLALGLGATIQITAERGVDPHHIWESVFRAVGEALREVFEENPWRGGTTAGVKGTLD
jgi:imidazoleglycerol-phosphate dehydratase